MKREYREIDTGELLRDGEFYVPAHSSDFEETKVYQADENGIPKDAKGGLPSEVTFSRIQDPASYISRLKSSAARRLECAEFMTLNLAKRPKRDGLAQEVQSEAGREVP